MLCSGSAWDVALLGRDNLEETLAMKIMTIRPSAALAALVLASFALSAAPASAKTVKACRAEWQAQKAAMQAAGKTEKAYIADCRTTTDASAAAPVPKTDKGDKGGSY
jgi:hypothetical protein